MDRLDRIEKILEKLAKSQVEADLRREENERLISELRGSIKDLGKNVRGNL